MQFADVAGRAVDADEVHAERERIGGDRQADRQSVGAPRIGQEAVALEVLGERLVGIGGVDRGEDEPRHDLGALREVVEFFPLRGVESVAGIGDQRRIRTVELDLHGLVGEAGDHRDRVTDDQHAGDGREQINQRAQEPHGRSPVSSGSKTTSALQTAPSDRPGPDRPTAAWVRAWSGSGRPPTRCGPNIRW